MEVYQEKIGSTGLTIMETDKYKSIKIGLKFRAPHCRETVTMRSLISMLLETNNRKYKTQTAFRKQLAYLYGANFYTSVEKKGNEHILSITFDLVDGKFVPDGENLLKEAFFFIKDALFDPNIHEGSFDEETLMREKENLKARLASIFDDKMRYASKRLIEEMFQDDVFKYGALGVLEDIEAINGRVLYNYYVQMLQQDQIDLFVCGDVTRNEIIPLVEEFPFAKRPDRPAQFSVKRAPQKGREVFEEQPINQGKLVMGYQTGVLFGEKEYVPLQLGNGLLGGYANSKIFINVREKASLAYYASSRLDTFKGYMLISAGIDEKNYQAAVEIIKEQVIAIKQGDFTEEELAQTKEMYINQLLETNDSASGMLALAYNNTITDAKLTINRWIEIIRNTTKAEVVQAINQLQEDTTYFLSKGAHQNEEN